MQQHALASASSGNLLIVAPEPDAALLEQALKQLLR